MSEQQTRNVRGGNGYKKKKSRRDKIIVKKEVILDVENGDGYYGRVLKLLGTNRILVKLHNNTETQVTIPGRLYKKVWIKPDNYILVNNYMEIEKVYRELDKDTDQVKRIFIQKTGEGNLEKITTIPKIEEDPFVSKVSRQEKEKERYVSKTAGRHFTNPDELEKDDIKISFYEETGETKEITNNSDNSDSVPIDKI